jgi:hypothetical protein
MNTYLGLVKTWVATILVLVVFTPEAQSSRIARRAQTICNPLQGASVIAHCMVTNKSKDPILILDHPLTLEGKLPGKGYFPIPSGGERSENVFEYVPLKEVWPGILGEPVRHLGTGALNSLILLAPGSKASFEVEWQEAQEVISSLKGLRARVKLMLLEKPRPGSDWSRKVERICGIKLPDFSKLMPRKAFALTTVRRETWEASAENSCEAAISEGFSYTYSNEIVLRD